MPRTRRISLPGRKQNASAISINVDDPRGDFPRSSHPRLDGHRADGLLVVFVVDDVDAEYTRLRDEGVEVTTPIGTEEWGERFFQATDPSGVVFQLVTWTHSQDA